MGCVIYTAVALAIHGGAFCLGDTHHIFLGHFRYLLDRGYCVVSIEYRLAPQSVEFYAGISRADLLVVRDCESNARTGWTAIAGSRRDFAMWSNVRT